jgi:hypothetical protein
MDGYILYPIISQHSSILHLHGRGTKSWQICGESIIDPRKKCLSLPPGPLFCHHQPRVRTSRGFSHITGSDFAEFELKSRGPIDNSAIEHSI